MARYKIPYPGLNESLKHLKTQVIHSLPYGVRNLPRFETPEQIFNYCKSRYTFKNDPPGVELFQTVPTLLTDNEKGQSGEGDCDDATIFVLTTALISGFTDLGIVLTGRTKHQPTHIYAYIMDNGKREILDLTNPKFNQERPYPFKQFIPFKISKQQLDMFLELADGQPTFKKSRRKKVTVRSLTPQEKEQGIYLPSKNVFVPVDRFDKLPIKKAKETLLSEGYEVEALSEYLSGRKERKKRKQYKQEKKNVKLEKKRAKTEVIKAKAQKKRDTGEAKKMRAKAKVIKSQKGGSGKGMAIFNKTADIAKDIFAKRQGGDEEEETNPFLPQEQTFQPSFDNEQYLPQEVETEEVEAEEVQPEEEELQEGGNALNKSDLVGGGLFLLGLFLEKRTFKKSA